MKLSFLVACCLPFFAASQNSEAAQQVKRLVTVSDSLKNKGAFDEAILVNDQAKKIALEQFGEESLLHGMVCLRRGSIYNAKNELPLAERWYLDSKKILEAAKPKDDSLYANALNNLGCLYMFQANFEPATTLILQAKSIRDSLFGGVHPDCARSLSNLATLQYYQGNYDVLDSLWNAAIRIWEQTGQTKEKDYFMCLNNLAGTYLAFGRLEESEQLFLRVRDLRAANFGKENQEYAMVLNNLGAVYQEQGDFENSVRFFKEAVDILLRFFGEENKDVAFSMANLGSCYNRLGDAEQAEFWLLKAIHIQEKTIGKNHPQYAASLNYLAILYSDMGINDKALSLYQEANAVEREALGNTHPQYAASLLNIAALLHEAGDYVQAAALYEEAGQIFENAFGKDNQWYLTFSGDVAILYRDMRQYEKAEAKNLETLEIKERILGKEHPNYAETLDNLAVLYSDMGNLEKSLSLHLEAKQIREKTLGREHPHYLESLTNLAYTYSSLKRLDEAAPLLAAGFEIEKKLLRNAFSHLSEKELTAYMEKVRRELGFSFQVAKAFPDMAGLCFNEMLFYKGFLLHGISETRKLTLSNPESEQVYQQLQSVHYQLAGAYSKPLDEQQRIALLEARADSLEKSLARQVVGFGNALRQTDWKGVQAQLKSGEAAIEFFQYKPGKSADDHYVALVLTNTASKPALVELFDQPQLLALLDLKGGSKPAWANALYGGAEGAQLYAMLWRPLEPYLKNVKTIYFSPSGLLNRLNLGAVPVNAQQMLADRYELVQLNSTRSLAKLTPEQAYEPTAILFGGIQYALDTTASSAPDAVEDYLANNTRSRGLELPGLNDPGAVPGWEFLRWTDIEVTATADILTESGLHPLVLKNSSATEESFKSVGIRHVSPRVLHLATHGFFFPDQYASNQVNPTALPTFITAGHPLMRSGLILSGGNYAWQHRKPYRAGGEDGILTAYEISQMDLRTTELVVLSACETALGDIRGSEGVYGLQRAFKIAGAKYLIMSLWQTSDFHTQELMTTFYANWMERKMPIPQAFDAAQKAMKTKYKEPFFWAGFILVE